MTVPHFSPKVGDWVEVRSVAEILATLDADGDLEHMPCMPEMLKFTGQRFRISAVAHKTCDTVNRTGGRTARNAVHLEDLRCDGGAHGGCQAACLIFWKTQWLRRIPEPRPRDAAGSYAGAAASAAVESASLMSHTSRDGIDGNLIYRCQATTLPRWSGPLHWWDVRQYWRDIRCGNASVRHVLATLLLAALRNLRRFSGGYRLSNWLYGPAHRWFRGTPDPHGTGTIRLNEKTPEARSDLRVGEVVEVRSRDEIYRTVNIQNRNRGLQIDAEMTKYCGGRFRVASRVTRIINEQTGQMMHFKNPCIVLEGADCMGEYSPMRLLCPRRITTYWREIWLRRVE